MFPLNAIIAMLLAACGPSGDGGSAASPVAIPTPEPTPAPASSPTPTPSPTPASGAGTASDGASFLGVQTHFSQGWPASSIDQAQSVDAALLRDSVPWSAGEKVRGSYDFSGQEASRINLACTAEMPVILTIIPDNPNYDGGSTVYTDAGRSAYAAYLNALIGKFGKCIVAFEIGNEINTANGLNYPAGSDSATLYVDLLRAVSQDVRKKHPDVAILGGSSNMIATGFLETLFKAGMLPLIDGVAVHPYRSDAQSVDMEIAHLNSVMAQYGTPVPIWATEFSNDLSDAAGSSGELVKMVTLLRAAGTYKAIWYALIDQKYYPNMGLFSGSTIKPTGKAFRLVEDRLLPKGKPQRVDVGDPLVFAYRYGQDAYVVWGAPRTVSFYGSASVVDAQGQALSSSGVFVGQEPIIAFGATGLSVGQGSVLADSELQYGGAPWSYLAEDSGGEHVLSLYDDQYSSYFGSRWTKPLRVTLGDAAPSGSARVVIRYTAPAAMAVDLGMCLSKPAKGDGVDWRIEHNGSVLQKGVLTGQDKLSGVRVDLAAGDHLDLSVGKNQAFGGDKFDYHIKLFRRGSGGTVACSN
ncbi:hypothetical protein GCM10023219_20950 [Stakelama sediminis]|uniref:Asl1-like glycosyl hydrolase catalytic domain-containing protein n=1 Tax=Stakelama sediminis TaxID=463200 RepID=A0A840Z221_9SPHN|nr:glycosyl hydrolase [Stakelama sediminis]MBB5719965.1 hypothetical protein [Stakelama sediminis]